MTCKSSAWEKLSGKWDIWNVVVQGKEYRWVIEKLPPWELMFRWFESRSGLMCKPQHHYTPRTTKLLGGILVSLRPSVRPSVRLSRLPCPLCNIYSSGWILSILATNDHYHERVCRTQWPLTLTYIFKVIRPWLRKSCPLCSIYSSEWILFIFGTNYHYH